MTYAESKEKINKLRKNEVLFRMAISHLMDVGIRHLTEENVNETCASIMEQDDIHSIMTNEFQCEIVRIAYELSKLDHIHLLTYISREVYYDVGGNEISYQRAIEIIRDCLCYIDDNYDSGVLSTETTLCQFQEMGLRNVEIESLGWGYLLDEEEEDDCE